MSSVRKPLKVSVECFHAEVTALHTFHSRLDAQFERQSSPRLTHHYTNIEDGKTLRRYWTGICQNLRR